MNKKIFSITIIFSLMLIVPSVNGQIMLGGEAKQKLIEVKINDKGEIQVKHVVESGSKQGSTLQPISQEYSNLVLENELGNNVQPGIIDDGLGNKSIFITPTKYNIIVKYNLENMILKDNLFSTKISYSEKFSILFDKSTEIVFVNKNVIFLDDKKGITINGGGNIKLEFYNNPSKIFKEVISEENKFNIEITTDSEIRKFNFDQASKSISFEINDENKYVTLMMPKELLGDSYVTLLNDEKIKYTKFGQEENVVLTIIPESKGQITISSNSEYRDKLTEITSNDTLPVESISNDTLPVESISNDYSIWLVFVAILVIIAIVVVIIIKKIRK